ncbi:MAG: S-layer homology domain-containing protein [Clostridia bacterium]|nr:S-layer homology domain-containing protein [Clostridia bacterium]
MNIFTKKIISIVMLFALLISGTNVICRADAESETVSEAMEVLRLLDIIPDYYDYNVDLDTYVTRADFANAVYNIINTSDYSSDVIYYYDVPATHWAYKAITYLTDYKIVSGTGEKIFNPDGTIEQAQAYKILLGIMGYSEYAEANGGYPGGYLITAKKAGISEDSFSNPLTRGDMFTLLYNVITANMYDTYAFSDGNIYKEVNKEETVLSLYRDIYYNEGTVTDTDAVSLSSISITERGSAVIDGVSYNTQIELKDYLGVEIRFLYSYDKSSGDKDIIWAAETGVTQYTELVVDNDAVFNSKDFVLTHKNESGKSKNYTLSKGIRVIYNGELIKENVSDILSMPEYKVKLIKNSGNYDIAIVSAYYNIVAGTLNTLDKMVYDKSQPQRKIELDEEEYDSFKMAMLGETELEFDDIQLGMVLSVYASNDKKHIYVDASGKKAEGILQSIDTANNIYTVENIDYELAYDVNANNVRAGDSVILYLDSNDEIAYIDVKESNEFAGFMMAYSAENKGLNNAMKIKLLHQNGNIEIMICASKVEVDGKMLNTVDDIEKSLTAAGPFEPTIALFKVNSEGEIISIDTPGVVENTDSLQVNVPYAEDLRYKSSGNLGAKSIMDDSTKIFSVPAKAAISASDDEGFMVISRKTLVNDNFVNAETYRTEEISGIEKYVVLYGFNESGYKNADSSLPIVVQRISTALNAEDEEVECIIGYQGGSTAKYMADKDVSFSAKGVTEGCLVRIALNLDGEVDAFTVFYDPKAPDKYKTSTTDINAGFRAVVGYASSFVDGVLRVSTDKGGSVVQACKVSGVPVVFYDSTEENNKIFVGTANDISTYRNDNESCSRVVVIKSFVVPRLIIVYK